MTSNTLSSNYAFRTLTVNGVPIVAPPAHRRWWPFGRKPGSRFKDPAFARSMRWEFTVHGSVRLSENHPEHEERKAWLLKKGFSYDANRRAWFPIPDWEPATA